MITRHNYRLVALPFGETFNLEKFREADGVADGQPTSMRLDRAFVEDFVIPAYAYSVLPAVPATDTRTLATRLVLVGSPRVDASTAQRVVELLMSPDISDLTRPPLSADLLKTSFQFARHPGTDQYLQSLKPVDVESRFVAYSRVVELWGLIIAVYVAAAKGLKMLRRRGVGERKSVGDFLGDVLVIEGAATPQSSRDDRIALDQRLTDVKHAAIRMHVDATLDHAESLPSLLTSIADARTKVWGLPSQPSG